MESEANSDSELQQVIHDTVEQMNDLQDNQNQLIDQVNEVANFQRN